MAPSKAYTGHVPNGAYNSSVTEIKGAKFHRGPKPVMSETYIPYHLPPPEEGTNPPAEWDEWEKNKNWPFPASQPVQQLRNSSKRLSVPFGDNQARPQPQPTEEELNANWPHPPAQGRKRTSSQLAPRPRKYSTSKSTERADKIDNASRPASSNAPKKPADSVNPASGSQARTPWMPISIPQATIHPLLSQENLGVMCFDLRLPYTSARKLVHGQQWTHLNHDDLRSPACTPPRRQMRIYNQVSACMAWIADVRPTTRDYVTVRDVLTAVFDTFNVPIDNRLWARDSVNPKLADRILRAFRKRIEKVASARSVDNETVRQAGIMRVDYFGSKHLFAGLVRTLGEDSSDWFLMQVVAEAKA